MDKNRIGEQIKYWRNEKGLTQGDLADAIGIKTIDAISKIERGERMPSFALLPKICAALGVDFDINFFEKP